MSHPAWRASGTCPPWLIASRFNGIKIIRQSRAIVPGVPDAANCQGFGTGLGAQDSDGMKNLGKTGNPGQSILKRQRRRANQKSPVPGIFLLLQHLLPGQCLKPILLNMESKSQNCKLLSGIAERARARKARMVCHRSHSHQEAEEWDLDFWQSVGPEQRLSALVALRNDLRKVEEARGARHEYNS